MVRLQHSHLTKSRCTESSENVTIQQSHEHNMFEPVRAVQDLRSSVMTEKTLFSTFIGSSATQFTQSLDSHKGRSS